MQYQNYNPSISIDLDRGSRASFQPEPLEIAEQIHPSLEFVSISDRDLSSDIQPKLESLDRLPRENVESKSSMSINSAKIDSLIEELKFQELPDVEINVQDPPLQKAMIRGNL